MSANSQGYVEWKCCLCGSEYSDPAVISYHLENCCRLPEHRARRERIATAAMQGFITNNDKGWPRPMFSAVQAVAFADALIAELDKEQQP